MEICVDRGDVDESDRQNSFKETLLIFQFFLNTIIPVLIYIYRVFHDSVTEPNEMKSLN